MPKLIAKERFPYNGRNVEADAEFDALEQDVALLTDSVSPRARKPDGAAGGTETRAMKSSDAGDLLDQGKPPKRYNRRDMRAKE
jgi:hypothetical protein